eukprot:757947-Hanusia_phi.AAC.3
MASGAWGLGGNEKGEVGVGDRAVVTSLRALVVCSSHTHAPPPGSRTLCAGAMEELSGCGVRAGGCGHEFSVVVSECGAVWACGENGSGQLGLGELQEWGEGASEEEQDLERVESQEGKERPVCRMTPLGTSYFEGGEVVMVSCGYDHVLCLLSSGVVLSWGEKYSGQLGVYHDDCSKPQVVEGLRSMFVVFISAGASHSLVINSSGELFSFGSNIKGQLGTGTVSFCDDDESKTQPRKVLFPAGQRIASCAGGGLHSVAVTSQGSVYSWGCNINGQTGHAGVNEVLSPRKVKFPQPVEAKRASCGFVHSAVLSREGEVWCFGRGKMGELGHGSFKNSSRPCRVEGLRGKRAVELACGVRNTFAVCESEEDDDVLYVWGHTEWLRNPREEDMVFPKHSCSPLPLELPAVRNALSAIICGPCASHMFVCYKRRLRWRRWRRWLAGGLTWSRWKLERVLWIGFLKVGEL